MADHVVAVTHIHGIAGRRDELRDLLARPSDMRVHRDPRTIVPEPSGPGDPRCAG
jgi:hypothetical protein